MQVQACFLAHKTATADQGAWMITALRGAAMRYWFFECRGESSAPENIIAKLKDRFRPYSYECDLYARLHDLRMTAQGYKSYADKFAELSAQLPKMELNALKHAFIKGLNAEFRQQVLLQGAKDLRGAQEVCRRLDLAQQPADRNSSLKPTLRQRGRTQRNNFRSEPRGTPRSSSRRTSGARAAHQDRAHHVANLHFAQTRGLAREADHLEAKDHHARAANHPTAVLNVANRAIGPANAQMHGSRQLIW